MRSELLDDVLRQIQSAIDGRSPASVLFLTGEAEEPSLHLARELGVHFVAAGHYATERLGVQALARKLAERFGIEADYIELGNPV